MEMLKTRRKWVLSLMSRLLALTKGKRYQIILTVYDKDTVDWTVTQLGKIEHPRHRGISSDEFPDDQRE